MPQRCLYCGKVIDSYTFRSFFLKEDELCPSCRKKMQVKRKLIGLGDFEVESFFEYDSIFKSLLLQFKECHDEALKNVFLYDLNDYLNVRYFGYQLLFVPSSERKRKERGFDHLEEIFSEVKLKRVKGLKMKKDLCQEGMDLDRRKRMTDNYIYEGKTLQKVLIVDDMMTTGSSLRGVYNCIKVHSKKIKVLSLAYKSITLHY